MSQLVNDIVTELYLGSWVDVSDDVLQDAGIRIDRGRAASRPDADAVTPQTCNLTLKDPDGAYSVRNPLGTYYGVIGRNTPIRVSLRLAQDTFARTVADGWGTADTGEAWSAIGTASDVDVSSGTGTHSVPSTGAFRATYLSAVSQRDVDVYATVQLPFSNVTGGDLEPINLLLRGISTSDYYMVRVVITSGEVITVKLTTASGTDYSGTVTVPLTYTGQQLAVRTQIEGQQWRAKVWAVSTGEPYDWDVSARVTDAPRSGWVGVRSGVASGNTNTKPIVFSYSAFEVRSPRYAGEVSEWPPQRDVTGQDRRVPITAAGMLRRLGQGDASQVPLRSVLRRSIPSLDNLVAYWPCEDGRDANSLASAIVGGAPMSISGTYSLATYEEFAASAPIPTVGSAIWQGRVPGYSGTGAIQLRWLMAVPAAGLADGAGLIRLHTTGSIGRVDLTYGTGGVLRIRAHNTSGTVVLDSSGGFGVDGKLIRVSVELSQDGSDVDWLLSTLEVGAGSGVFISGTITGQSVSAAVEVDVSLLSDLQNTAFGHITVESAISSLFDLVEQLDAYAGETATDRLTRLCSEEDVAFAFTGTPDSSALMGPQRPDGLISLLIECAVVDQGQLGESRGTASLLYRTRASLYDQAPAVTLDVAGGDVVPPLQPTDDDRMTRNDVTVTRADGSSARAVLESGRMSVLDPADGGVGRYDVDIDANVANDGQAQYLADWLMAVGTVDEQRWPTVPIELARLSDDATMLAQLVDLDVGDLVEMENLESFRLYDDALLLPVGYSEELNRFTHRLTLNCVPAVPYRVVEWDDSTYGRYDSSSTTLGAGVTSSATSLSLATTGNELWTTNAAHFPLDISIGGEVIRLSAISGSSSPQTATVSFRAVNGVTKAHSAGAEVHLAEPNRWAL